MALKINGTTVVDDSRNYTNINSITFADATTQTTAGGTGGSVGTAVYEAGALIHTLDNPNAYGTSDVDLFSYSVSISGNYAIVGAYAEDDASGNSSGKAYIFDVMSGTLLYTLNNPDAYGTGASDSFGISVDIDGKYAIVGAYSEEDATGSQSGKAYIFDVTTGGLVTTLDNPNAYGTSSNDYFGASVSISGNYAIVSAIYEDDASGLSSGKAYIFNVTTGNLLHTLDNPNPYGTSLNDYFGHAVAISGNYAIVGAYGEDDADGTESGKAYIFNVVTGELVHTLDNPNVYTLGGNAQDDRFGHSVAIDGNYAAVAAINEDSANGSLVGRVYVYDVTSGSLLQTLSGTDSYGEQLGYNASLSISGNYLIAGEPNHPYYTFSGRALVFDVTTGEKLLTLENPNAYSTINSDYFGYSAAISGSYAIVGAYEEDDAGGSRSGKAYIFAIEDVLSASGIKEVNFVNAANTNGLKELLEPAYVQGELVHTLAHPNYLTSSGHEFGNAVAMHGNYAIVGAHYGDSEVGTAHVFDVTTGRLVHSVTNPDIVGAGGIDDFGWAVGISDDYFIVGSYQEEDPSSQASNAGVVYVYHLKSGNLLYRLDNPNAYGTTSGDAFGNSIAIYGKYACIAAYNEDDASGLSSGKVYIFDLTTGTLVRTLDNPNAYSTSQSDNFGYSVAMSSEYIIVGAYQETDASLSAFAGAAYVFDFATGDLIYTLSNPNDSGSSQSDYFGWSVAISNEYAIVSTPSEEGQSTVGNAGIAYVFNLSTGALSETLYNPNFGGGSDIDEFGNAVAISGDYAIIAAQGDGSVGGAVYIYELSSRKLLQSIKNPNAYNTVNSDYFGWSVAISGNYAIVGAKWEDSTAGGSVGRAYIFSVKNQTYLDKLTTMVS